MGLFKNEAVATGSPFRTGALKTEADVIEGSGVVDLRVCDLG